jgi:Spy/CpxP family protein refolding chaperone
MNRSLKVSLFIAGIFACGVIVGAFGAKRLASGYLRPVSGAGEPDGFGPNLMRRLTAELALSEEQRATIEPVIKRTGEELRVLRQESMRQSAALIDSMNVAVSAELTPGQRAKFEVMKAAQKARMKAIMEERQRRRVEGRGRGHGEPDEREMRPPPETQ